jgi:hypothetical protein
LAADDDDTIRLAPARAAAAQAAPLPPPLSVPAPARPTGNRGAATAILGVLALLLAAGGGAVWLLRPQDEARVAAPPQVPAPPAIAPPTPVPAPPAVTLPAPTPPFATPMPPPAAPPMPPVAERLAGLPPLLDEAAIAAHRAPVPVLLRFAGNPAVFVIDFPTLEAQGAALNRVAALVEKAGLPRERVLNEAEMAAAIAAAGDTPGTFYFGHNYRGVDLARFFRLAAEGGQALRPEEAWVEQQFRHARALVPAEQEIVVLSIAAPDARMEPSWRATILRHELGHGLYGTRPAYAAHIRRVWRERFSEAERAAFRAFLAREGYDATNEELMIDETQAYLLHTPDARFFAPGHVGMDATALERLRGLLRQGAPQIAP